MAKQSLTIGIPAYNEAGNLSRLLPALLSQHHTRYYLQRILVVSDGSSDRTVSEVRSFNHPLLTVVAGRRRLGKPARVNQIFSHSSSDIVAIIDADVLPGSSSTLDLLTAPFASGSGAHFTSGHAIPFPPANLIQTAAFAGARIWDLAVKQTPKSQVYRCVGQIRAFSRPMYRQLRFPDSSSEDVYPYLFAVGRHFKFRSCPRAVVYFHLPGSVTDYLRQQTRYLRSRFVHSSRFGSDLVNKYFVVNAAAKLRALAVYFLRHPLASGLYLGLAILSHLSLFASPPDTTSLWDMSVSTKKLSL
ncbi:hypothetical protein A3B58_02860 [Candidatus Amesbacteria bacterium RIFCSPLOWO2_01_FULL_48_50]|nr:MAG: hypothetical protein A3B58_02860 [Candidatus Amesbacteria bacterium RIFCSPLOWO2_01_FULL_48_50]